MDNKDQHIPLSSTDCFFLALENHEKRNATGGHICHYIISLDGTLKREVLQKRVEESELFNWLFNRAIQKSILRVPQWVAANKKRELTVETLESTLDFPALVQHAKLDFQDKGPIAIRLIHHPDRRSSIILSWHHLLMDGKGVLQLIRDLSGQPVSIADARHKAKPTKPSWRLRWQTYKLFAWHTYLFWNPFSKARKADVDQAILENPGNQRLTVIPIEKENLQLSVDQNANGVASHSKTTFYLSKAITAVHQLLLSKGKRVDDFWIPFPFDLRKKGAPGAILGNHLTFLFFNIDANISLDENEIRTTIQAQIKTQLKTDFPRAYDRMMSGFRMLPSRLYYQLIKGSRGKSLASFLFTMAIKHPEDIDTFLGLKINRAISLPPNTFPPGLTLAVMESNEKVELVLLTYENMWSDEDINVLKSHLTNSLSQSKSTD